MSHCYTCLMTPRVDPRVERTHQAVLDAASMLLRTEGPGAVTHARVAELAGVGRATVYRHWPEHEDLLHDAVARKAADIEVPPTDLPTAERLRRVLEELRARLTHREGSVQFATLIAHSTWDKTLRRALMQVSARAQSVVDTILRDAVDRGELPSTTDVEVVRDGLLGSLLFRRFLTERRLDRAYLEQVIDNAVPGVNAAAAAPSCGGRPPPPR
jgi:AcrR family transcriptional regulator